MATVDPGAIFKSVPCSADQIARMDDVRGYAEALIRTIQTCAPDCADRTAAIRKVREAIWTVNYAISHEEK